MNNETIGQSAEYALCKYFNIECNINEKRINEEICESILSQCSGFEFPKIVQSIGHQNNSVDYLCENGKTLSLKTLKRDDGKICPQLIGQPTLKKWDQYWNLDFNGELSRNCERFEWIKQNVHYFLNEMLKYTYCCDYMILISGCNKLPKLEYLKKIEPTYFVGQGIQYTRDVYEEKYNEKKQKYSEFSTTLKINNNPIGELQFHKTSRKVLKFRFYRSFLIQL